MSLSIIVYYYIIYNIVNMCIVYIFNRHLRTRTKKLIWRHHFNSVESLTKSCYSFSDNLVCSILTS